MSNLNISILEEYTFVHVEQMQFPTSSTRDLRDKLKGISILLRLTNLMTTRRSVWMLCIYSWWGLCFWWCFRGIWGSLEGMQRACTYLRRNFIPSAQVNKSHVRTHSPIHMAHWETMTIFSQGLHHFYADCRLILTTCSLLTVVWWFAAISGSCDQHSHYL